MEAGVVSAPAQATLPGDSNRGSRGRGRGRGRGRARRGGHAHWSTEQTTQQAALPEQPAEGIVNTLLAIRPSQIPPSAPTSADPLSANHSATERTPQQSRGRGRGRGHSGHNEPGGRGGFARSRHEERSVRGTVRSHRGRGSHANTLVHGSGRQFGGQLTATSGTDPASSPLQADAPVFTPGQLHHSRPQSQRTPARKESIQKSEAPDIATRTHEDIAHGIYECPICTNEVKASSKIWSCKTCWTVFHLRCITTWAKNEGSKSQQRQEDGEIQFPRQWRCPGCNLPKDTMPSTHHCWCEKEIDPRPISGIPPHSCGQTCGKARILPKKCPHPCELLCHAGPCPPCPHMGPTQICYCGKTTSTKRCSETNYNEGWSCGEICGDIMPCGEHDCPRPCHEGLCGSCEVLIDARCYCGKSRKEIVCDEREDGKRSKCSISDTDRGARVDSWEGIFDCRESCGRDFDCGKHHCEKNCHPQDLETPHCPRSPDVVDWCPCGKTSLVDLLKVPRQLCTDPIPNCTKLCLKRLPCGHLCQQFCHTGDCKPCYKTVDISCRCGRTTVPTMCHQGIGEPPLCMRTCKAMLNCGRHACGEHCCQGERKAAERTATKKKLRSIALESTLRRNDEVEAEHICTKVCGRPLKCGNHTCEELCHKGPCGSCREAIFDELSCNCGRTVLQPPLPCGASPPPCRYPCRRPKSCGHPKVEHNCHGDESECPKCPFLIEKACMCGKKTLKNQPCFLQDVRCGEICGKKLRCGLHYCRKPCHRPGECETSSTTCKQQCGKEKKCCGHPCEDICHGETACKEEKPCQHKTIITCDCQTLKTETKCLSSKSSEGNSKKYLKCDDECARLERNRQLAMALNIDPSTHKDDHIPYSNATLSFYQEFTKWSVGQERELRIFAADETAKRLRFKPMQSHQRAFIHNLADDFGFDSESVDPEPHRHVAIFKTPRFVKAPMKTLAECIRIRSLAAVTPAGPSSQALRGNNDPFNGFVLSSPRFALTIEELRSELSPLLSTHPDVSFDISFLPNEEIVLKVPSPVASTPSTLTSLKPAIKSLILSKSLAAFVHLCALDSSLNVLRKETDPKSTEDGWSTVAAKAASGMKVAPRKEAVGGKSSFMVLGTKAARKKKEEVAERERESEVVDDWEEEVRLEEEREAIAKRNDEADGDGEHSGSDGEEIKNRSGSEGEMSR